MRQALVARETQGKIMPCLRSPSLEAVGFVELNGALDELGHAGATCARGARVVERDTTSQRCIEQGLAVPCPCSHCVSPLWPSTVSFRAAPSTGSWLGTTVLTKRSSSTRSRATPSWTSVSNAASIINSGPHTKKVVSAFCPEVQLRELRAQRERVEDAARTSELAAWFTQHVAQREATRVVPCECSCAARRGTSRRLRRDFRTRSSATCVLEAAHSSRWRA